MLPPPGSVVVGPYRLTLTVDQAAIDRATVERGGNELAGSYDSSTGRIAIKPGLTPDLTADCLLHEILHAVCEVAGKPLDDETEERAVSALAPTLLDTLRRNPDVTAWLMGA